MDYGFSKISCKIFVRGDLRPIPFSQPCPKSSVFWSGTNPHEIVLYCRRIGKSFTPPKPEHLKNKNVICSPLLSITKVLGLTRLPK